MNSVKMQIHTDLKGKVSLDDVILWANSYWHYYFSFS